MARLDLMIAELDVHDLYFCAAGDIVALQSCFHITARPSLLELSAPSAIGGYGKHERLGRDYDIP